MKLDKHEWCGHTRTTMTRSVRALDTVQPLAARLPMLGLVILTVILILPL
jgi:hypothetical protein